MCEQYIWTSFWVDDNVPSDSTKLSFHSKGSCKTTRGDDVNAAPAIFCLLIKCESSFLCDL